jgi:mannosyltransferase
MMDPQDLVLDNIIFSLQKMGGISVYWGHLLKTMAPLGSQWIDANDSTDNMVRSGLPLPHRVWSAHPHFFNRYRTVDTKAKFLHSSYYRQPQGPNTKLITTVYDFTYERYRRGMAKWIHHRQKYRAIMESSLVFAISNSTADDILRYCGPALHKKIVVTHLAADPVFTVIDGADEFLSQKLKTTDNEFLNGNPFCIFVGSRIGYKRFDAAVKMVEQVKNLNLVAIGGEDLSSQEIELLNSLVKEKRFIKLTGVSQELLAALYNRAYALLYPSDYEGFGIPVIEAARCLCPVIAQRTSSIKEVCSDQKWLINPKSLIEDGIDRLRQLEGAAYRRQVTELEQTFSKRFSWEATMAKTLEAYARL